uniref:Apple domain-containing protein n=1 Tax=Setaria digitata TaxID=48799 RepID=A0A915PUV0_9BILA
MILCCGDKKEEIKREECINSSVPEKEKYELIMICHCSNAGNELDLDKQKVVTLGPPRGGLQRAVFDEVSSNDISGFPREIIQVKNDIDAYDDKFVDLRGEDPLFVPEPYRDEKSEQVGSRGANTVAPFTTSARTVPTRTISRTSFVTRPPVPSQQFFRPLPGQSLSRQEFLRQPSLLPPRIVSQQRLPTKMPSRFETSPQTSFLLSQFPQFPRQQQQPRTTGIPTAPPRTLPTTKLPPRRIISHPRPSDRLGLPAPSRSTSESLRTGVCHASIFYISTPMQNPRRHSFTHFAVTVSTDQCARTCHEFNCAVAHYDPGTGRCQFNPSTAFAIRRGQCPPWPATHYKNNIRTDIPLRIFCVQCHRNLRRERINSQESRFRTSVLKTLYTGRLQDPLQASGVIRAHSVLLKQPNIIMESSLRNISLELEKQSEQATEEWSTKQISIRNSSSNNNKIWSMSGTEAKAEAENEADKSIGKQPETGEQHVAN